MILAGGLSTRLYPLTRQVPKPLVPVAGEPNAVHLIRYLQSYGITDIAINVHYLADMIVQTLGDGSKYGVHLEYLYENVLLGSAGAVEQMKYFLGDAPFVVGRCTRDDSVRRIRESSPRNDPELQRYRRAGAWAAAVREVPERRCESGRLFTSRD